MNVQGSTGCKVYESEHIRSICGETIRPGGYDLTRRALELCGIRSGQTLLDIGCGYGASMEFIRENFGWRCLELMRQSK